MLITEWRKGKRFQGTMFNQEESRTLKCAKFSICLLKEWENLLGRSRVWDLMALIHHPEPNGGRAPTKAWIRLPNSPSPHKPAVSGPQEQNYFKCGGGAMTHSSHITQLAPHSTSVLLTASMVFTSLRAVCSAVRAVSTYASEGPCELLKSRLTVGATERVSIPAMPHRAGRWLHLRPQTIAAAYVTL